MTTPIDKKDFLYIKFKSENEQPSFNNPTSSKKLFLDTSTSSLSSQSLDDPLPTTKNSDLHKKNIQKPEEKKPKK